MAYVSRMNNTSGTAKLSIHICSCTIQRSPLEDKWPVDPKITGVISLILYKERKWGSRTLSNHPHYSQIWKVEDHDWRVVEVSTKPAPVWLVPWMPEDLERCAKERWSFEREMGVVRAIPLALGEAYNGWPETTNIYFSNEAPVLPSKFSILKIFAVQDRQDQPQPTLVAIVVHRDTRSNTSISMFYFFKFFLHALETLCKVLSGMFVRSTLLTLFSSSNIILLGQVLFCKWYEELG